MNPYLAPGVAIPVDLDIEYVQLYIPTQAVLIEADRNSPAEVLEIPHDAVTENTVILQLRCISTQVQTQ